jgi:hypothetical protein
MQAFGSSAGAYIADLDHSGVSYVGYGDRGIWAKGNFAGGTFSHPDNVTYWADVATPTRKIVGTGTVSFVQNHPHEKDKVVVYAAPEGDEVAVYTRRHRRAWREGWLASSWNRPLPGSRTRTSASRQHLTPRSDASLYVESVSSRTLVVAGPDGVRSRRGLRLSRLRSAPRIRGPAGGAAQGAGGVPSSPGRDRGDPRRPPRAAAVQCHGAVQGDACRAGGDRPARSLAQP